MTDNKTSNNRSKLTLKLPSSVSSPEINFKNQNKDKKNSSAVHVTIKGRKKDNSSSADSGNGLNKKELEARMKAISSSNNQDEEIKTHEILNKKIKDQNPDDNNNINKDQKPKTLSIKKTHEVKSDQIDHLEITPKKNSKTII